MIDAIGVFKAMIEALKEGGVECHMASLRYLNKNKVVIACTLVMTTEHEIEPVMTPLQELELGKEPEHTPIPDVKDRPGHYA